MSEPTIRCPQCQSELKLTESLAAPLLEATRKQFENKLAQKDLEVQKREHAIKQQQIALEQQQETMQEKIEQQLKSDRERIALEEAKKARAALHGDIESKTKEVSELQLILKEREEKLAAAQQAQADLIRKQRELDDAKREMELTIEKKVQESLEAIRGQAKRAAEDELMLKVQEKEQVITSMQKQIEDLKRRSEQGSQQLQGEVVELALETALRQKFPHDVIEPVAKGEFGGDVVQRIFGMHGQCCGAILWESKHTKNWSDGWLQKLREDQRRAKAEVAILVSHTLPKDLCNFDFIEGVWVTEPRCAVPVALALRQSLVELHNARQMNDGQQTKTELVYQYLTGPRFRHRVQAIVEKFSDMQEDLDKERKVMLKQWAKREEQIRGVIEATAGMYGDLQGIAGRSLQEVEGLDVKLLDAEVGN